MNLENLTQFNKKHFKKFLGLYIKERRVFLDLTENQVSEWMGFSSSKTLRSIESGQKNLSQSEFDHLCYILDLNQTELLSLGKITQVQNILDLYREIDAQYPK